MCYPCTQCGKCGKYEETSPFFVPTAPVPCLKCGGTVNTQTGVCEDCGVVAFAPSGTRET